VTLQALDTCANDLFGVAAEQFFLRNVLNEKSALHYLLPNKRDVNIVNRLRHAETFELSQTRTERFQKNRSSHTVLHISNSIYGRYTLFI